MCKLKVVIDGTPESLRAAEFAIELATRLDHRLTAIALINTRQVLCSTGYRGTGLCGSGVFLDAYERMLNVDIDVADALMEALTARAGGRDVTVDSGVLIGDPLMSIKENTNDDDFYILGGTESNIELAREIFQQTHRPVAVCIEVQGETPKVVLMADDSDLMDDLAGVFAEIPNEYYWFDLEQCPLFSHAA